MNTVVMMVDVYDGATPLGSVAAGAFRAEVGAAIGDKGFHAFSFATPVGLKDGKTHTIMVRPDVQEADFGTMGVRE